MVGIKGLIILDDSRDVKMVKPKNTNANICNYSHDYWRKMRLFSEKVPDFDIAPNRSLTNKVHILPHFLTYKNFSCS